MPTIHCAGCAERVREIVGRVDGVELVEVDRASKRAVVTYQGDTVIEDDIRQRLTRAGHTVE